MWALTEGGTFLLRIARRALSFGLLLSDLLKLLTRGQVEVVDNVSYVRHCRLAPTVVVIAWRRRGHCIICATLLALRL
jgi:hypothetical protein